MKIKNILKLIVIGIILSNCSSKSVEEQQEKDNYCLGDFKDKIELSRPKKQMMTTDIHLTGVVEPNPENVAQFSNSVDGIIVKTHFSLGDYVEKGQILAELKSTELSGWQSQQRILTEQLNVAQQEFTSAKRMFKDGILSNKEYSRHQSEVASIQAELDEISTNMELYNASSKSNVFLIKAVQSGYIIEKNIYPGKHIEAYGESLFTIAELYDVWVQVNLYSSDLKHIKEGMEVNIESLAYPDSIFTGQIEAISYVLDQESRLTKARVSLKNRSLLLKPGMFVDVMAKQESEIEVMGIPLSAIIFDNDANFIIDYNNDCDIKVKEIDFVGQSGETAYITNSITVEDKIITKNHLLIYEQIKNFDR